MEHVAGVEVSPGRFTTQDPKYDIENGRLINAASGKPIPLKTPVFMFLAHDEDALPMLRGYEERLILRRKAKATHIASVQARVKEFTLFKDQNHELMHVADTTPREGAISAQS